MQNLNAGKCTLTSLKKIIITSENTSAFDEDLQSKDEEAILMGERTNGEFDCLYNSFQDKNEDWFLMLMKRK